jgi:hypothetical protein
VPLAATSGTEPAGAAVSVRTVARHAGLYVLVGEAGGGLLAVLGGRGEPGDGLGVVAAALPPGPGRDGPALG